MLFQYDEQGEQLGQEPEPPEQREPPEQPEPPEQQQELPEEPLPEEVADGGPRDSYDCSGCRMDENHFCGDWSADMSQLFGSQVVA
jgi:hypothetical protein